MDNFTSMGAISHRLELYTDTLLITGAVHGPFKRATDLLNRGDTDFLAVRKATITPLGQPPSQKVLESPVMVARSRIHFAIDADAMANDAIEQARQRQQGAAPLGGESFIRKTSFPCYAITSVYVIYGFCHLLHDAHLENLLRGNEGFIPLTKATIYLVNRPAVSWQREVAIVNRLALTAMYLLSPVEVEVPA